MTVIETSLTSVLLLQPRLFRDERGLFLEAWNEQAYRELGLGGPFVQDNLSRSARGVLRGLHYQNPGQQGKLVTVVEGEVFDVVVDLRVGSTTFGNWLGVRLSGQTLQQLWVPAGFAHGFQVLGDTAIVSYKCTHVYAPQHERSLRWDDPDVGIAWPMPNPVLSQKDLQAPLLRDIPPEHLFVESTSANSGR